MASKNNNGRSRRAAIYVRVSSERQAAEDRLCRGIYAAVPLAKLLEESGGRIDIELVREVFDRKMFFLKAALAKIESDNIRERTEMGRMGRLERGEVPGGAQVRYGYEKVDKHLVINESEAEIVRQIYKWYLTGDQTMAIRRRLNAQGVATRSGQLWSKATIGKILRGEFYATGKVTTRLGENTYHVFCPPIISLEEWQMAVEMRRANRKAAKHVKREYLCQGLVYCACGYKVPVAGVPWQPHAGLSSDQRRLRLSSHQHTARESPQRLCCLDRITKGRQVCLECCSAVVQ
jgi:DNA invertase Pin-like site-specific DNA recombinase